MALLHDHDLFPLLWYRFEGEATEDDAARFAAVNRPMLERGQRENIKTLTFIDGLAISRVGAPARRRFGEYSKTMREEELAQHSAGGVILISNPLVRGAMTAVGWISSSSMDNTKIGKDIEAGIILANALCASAGQPLDKAITTRLLSTHYAGAA